MPANGHETSLAGQNPPLACGQSAPFDKGVYTAGPAKLAANAVPGN